MRKDWRESDEGKDRVKKILQQSGVPLETRSLQLVQEFCKEHSSGSLRATDLGPVLWGKKADQAYRELDAAALLRDVMLFDTVQVVVEAYYLIEAKYREGVEWFAFGSPHSSRLPTASNAAFSDSVIHAYLSGADNLNLSRLAALKTDGAIPDLDTSKAFKEQLTQNVGASLAELVLDVAKATLPVTYNKSAQTAVRESGIIPNALLQGEDWRSALPNFLSELRSDPHCEFHNKCNGPHPLIFRFFIPVLVVNGRLNRVETQHGEIAALVPLTYTVTGGRLPHWPSADIFLEPSAHFPLYVTDPSGLKATLQAGYDYVLNVRGALASAHMDGRTSMNSAALESVITALVLEAREGMKIRVFREDPSPGSRPLQES